MSASQSSSASFSRHEIPKKWQVIVAKVERAQNIVSCLMFKRMLRFLYHTLLLCLVVMSIKAQRRPQIEKCDSLICLNGGECYAFGDPDEDGILDPQCVCPFNVTGPLCETPASCNAPCYNGGTCQFGESWWLYDEEFVREVMPLCSGSGYSLEDCGVLDQAQYCQCPPNVFGSNCETACDLQCQNNGTCEPWGDQPRCKCDHPNYGDLCEKTCSKACQNGGRCLAYDTNNDTMQEEICLCPSNFTGDFCDTERPCSKACINGGQCQQDPTWWLDDVESLNEIFERFYYGCRYQDGSADLSQCLEFYTQEYCQCPPDTFGEFCHVTCDIECKNGGSCEVRGDEARCRCQPGFFGDFCEEACDLSCRNGGQCVAYDSNNDSIKEMHCLCPSNFTGDLCTEPRECQTECLNGGSCVMDEAWFLNELDFIDEILDELMYECFRANGFADPTCIGLVGREYCQCPPDVWGSQCEFACDLDCGGSNGNCTYNRFNEKQCMCRPGYSGDKCQYQCSTECENKGKCVSDGTTESCQCTPYWEGDRCQTAKTCSKSCSNGGTCVFADVYSYDEDYFAWCLYENNENCPDIDGFERCDCPQGWVGADCSSPCPCENGGACSTWRRELEDPSFPDRPPDFVDDDEVGNQDTYYCACPFGFYGDRCQYEFGDSDCSLQCLNGGYCENEYIFGNSNSSNQNVNGSDTDAVSTTAERCVCPGNFTGPNCGKVLDACYNMCQNGVCSTATTSTHRFGGRALQGGFLSPEEDPAYDYGPGHFGAFCECDDGYSGEYCERKACGSGVCANGAACIDLPAGQTTAAGDDYVCDCAVASLGAGFDDTTYIGRQCESVVHHECISDAKNPNENWQCANYGRCFYGTSGPQCRCDWGFQGPRCETNSTDTKDIAWSQCTLACQNGGTCLKGVVKPIASMFTRFLEPTKKSKLFDYTPSASFEYCYCPTGFFGVECEMQYALCGNGDHICFHGSTCEQTGGEWTCDCTGTGSAGLYCQYQATDDCSDSDADTFCTNGSTCGADKNCSCLAGWEGDKCEIEVKTAAIQGGGEKWSDANSIRSTMLFWTIASIALVVI